MNTPICDFVKKYTKSNSLRLHMPGHKGISFVGPEKYDITEISGADSLYEASGIIAESEANASRLFGCNTFYTTEGSSHAIRAMLYLALQLWDRKNEKPVILAGRNAHKSFINATASLDYCIEWIYGDTYLSCNINADMLEEKLKEMSAPPFALYITSPDYLGNVSDIASIGKVCKKHGILLFVDNAHGAYLKFMTPSQHPIDLGADMCCDSAHKTLPVLTGGAYLHISEDMPEATVNQAKNALSLFGSTSPSYLTLQSLDMANKYLNDGYREKLCRFIEATEKLKSQIKIPMVGNELLKITLAPKSYGYTGTDLAMELEKKKIICEFADPDFTVLMLTPQTGKRGLLKIKKALNSIKKLAPITTDIPEIPKPEIAMSPREAMFSQKETADISQCTGRVLATASIGCPPAVPIIVSGEVIDERVVSCFKYYNITEFYVVKEH